MRDGEALVGKIIHHIREPQREMLVAERVAEKTPTGGTLVVFKCHPAPNGQPDKRFTHTMSETNVLNHWVPRN